VAGTVGAGKVVELEAFLAAAQAGNGAHSPKKNQPPQVLTSGGINLRGHKNKLIVH
jgi:hypothetical protein